MPSWILLLQITHVGSWSTMHVKWVILSRREQNRNPVSCWQLLPYHHKHNSLRGRHILSSWLHSRQSLPCWELLQAW